MLKSDEINKELITILEECVAAGEVGEHCLHTWFFNRREVLKTLVGAGGMSERIQFTPEQMNGIRQDKSIREFANRMALDQVCPSGKDPSTQYEIGQVKILSDYGYFSIKKWIRFRDRVKEIWMKSGLR